MAKRYEWPFPLTMGKLHQVLSDFFSNPIINQTSATLATPTSYAEKIITINRATGVAITLPPALATGDLYTFYVGTTMSGGSTTITKATGTSDTFVGQLESATTTGATTNGFCEALGGADVTITLNGGTTGGVAGSYITFRDIASGKWLVNGFLIGTATLATSVS